MGRKAGEAAEELHWVDEGLPGGESLRAKLDGQGKVRAVWIIHVEDKGVGH